jgi:hypothetical protein
MCLVANWTFLTSHARVLLCIAHGPGGLAARRPAWGITERSAYSIVADLTTAGYIVKQKDRRRNRYQIQAHLPPPEPTSRERAVRYAALRHPEHAASISRVLAIPPKRWDRTIVTFPHRAGDRRPARGPGPVNLDRAARGTWHLPGPELLE